MKLSEEKELALSNSQLNYCKTDLKHSEKNFFQQLDDYKAQFGFVGCYIDRLSIVGNLTEELRKIIVNDLNAEIKFFSSEFFKGQLFAYSKENFYVEYDIDKAR